MPEYRGGDALDRRKRYDTLRTSLWAERSSFDSHWLELGNFFMPRRTRFWASDRNRGDKRNQNIINSIPRYAARTLSAGLHSGLTSPARPWMKLTTPDPDLAKHGPVKTWLYDVTQRMLTIFATTNLYNVLPLVYLDMGIFGTGCMSIVDDAQDLFRCYSYPIGTYALGLDARGLATTFIRDYQMSVRQVVEQFGVQPDGRDIDWTHISLTVKNLWDRGDYESPVEVTWVVKPNEYKDRKRFQAKYLPWSSCYYETGNSDPVFLRESGFKTFPIQAPRWDITGEDTYGTDCPGMTALGDAKQVQIMERRKGQLLQKAVDPPLQGPPELRTQKVSLLAGDITYVQAGQSAGLKPIHEIRLEGFQYLSEDISRVEYRIQRAFYEDLFLMLARSDEQLGADRPTAREIDERHEEKLLGLGPVLERTNDELLGPIVDRVYQLMEDRQLIPPPPEELDGVQLKVEYISILAEAQKLLGVVGLDRMVRTVAGMVQIWPEARHKLDTNEVVNEYREILGTDPRVLRSDEEASALVEADRKAQADQMQADQAAKVAGAAKDASQAPVTGDSMLARMVANAQAQAPGVM